MKTNFIKTYQVNKNICEGLISFFNNNSHQWVKGHSGGEIKNHIKKSTELGISLLNDENINFVKYKKQLMKFINDYKKKYVYCDRNQSKWGIKENINIQKYFPNEGYFHWHYENRGCEVTKNRHLVFMTYLNTVKNGGTKFLYQKKTFNAIQGLTLIWPATWTHTHQGVIAKKEKLIITGWLSFL
tara:strand:- start:892 stop:1446 length:555 start_codon:yes stop_codon:yes gene_type:complete